MGRRLVTLLAGVVFSLVCATAAVSSARAESPWWHLSAGARPTYLHAGVSEPGASEVQEIFTEPGDFPFGSETFKEQTNFKLFVGGPSIEEFATEPVAKTFGVTLLSAENIQKTLERP